MTSAFDDPRAQKSDELSFFADRALAHGEIARAMELFAEAAELETQLALGVPDTEPRVRSVLAISAVALWLKAGQFEKCERYAHQLLANDNSLTDQGRNDLRALLERCWREKEAQTFSKEAIDLVPLEMKLDGGRIRRGLAPASLVRDRQQTLTSLLVRTAELEMKRPFRKRGEAKKHVLERAGVYEAPALAASYGIRLYVGSATQLPLLADQITSANVVQAFLRLAALAQNGSLESVTDEDYRSAFLAGFRDLAPDGSSVEAVTYSTPASYLRAPSSVFGSSDRERLSAALVRDHSEGSFEVTGVLKVISLKGRFISIDPDDDEDPVDSVRFAIDAGKFDDTVGPKLNRRVRVLAETRRGKHKEPKTYAVDILTVDEDTGALAGPESLPS